MDALDNVFAFLKDNKLNNLEEDVVNAHNVKDDSSYNKKPKSKIIRRKQTGGRLSCDKCDYKCDEQRALKYHIEAVHLKIKRFQCGECSYKSYLNQNVRTHMKSVHKGIISKVMKIVCAMCQNEEIHDTCETVILKERKTVVPHSSYCYSS